MQVPPKREPTILSVQIPEHWFFPWSSLANPNLTGFVALTPLTAISCIINTVSLSFSGIQPRRTNIIAAASGRFHAVILQEASDHVPHISDQFIAHTGNTDLAILLNKDTFEPDPLVLAFREDSTSKGTLIVRGLLRAPHFLVHQQSHFAQYTFIMSLPRNVTHPLSYFSGYTGT